MTYKRPTVRPRGPQIKRGQRPTGPGSRPGPAQRSGGRQGPPARAGKALGSRPRPMGPRPTGPGKRSTGIPTNAVRVAGVGKKRPTLTKEEAAFYESDPTLSDDWLDEFMP